jgi:F-type H+-transporting ATPase subunit b
MRARAVVFAIAVLVPAIAFAEEHGGGGGGHEGNLVWHAINLALVVGVIVYFARSPIQAFMAERRSSIESNLAAAKRELDSAEARLAECTARANSLDREIAELRAAVQTQAEAERDRLLADARAAAERIRRDAAVAVEQEGRRARDELREEAAEIAVKLAGDLLKRSVGDADRARLVDEFVASVESSRETTARS